MFDLRRAFHAHRVFGMPKALSSIPPTSSVLDEGRLLSRSDIADYLGISEWWVSNVFAKEVPPKKVGRLNRWEPWQVRAYLDRVEH